LCVLRSAFASLNPNLVWSQKLLMMMMIIIINPLTPSGSS
jgi:hypothetical protein